MDAGLYFDRPITARPAATFDQTLEPHLYYLYIPFRDQSRLPNFTTAEKDFNFTTIFTENRFVGGDRVGDANQITLGLTSRMIESSTGLERLTASLGQVYYFTPAPGHPLRHGERQQDLGHPRRDRQPDVALGHDRHRGAVHAEL